jgi:hypothetical protein
MPSHGARQMAGRKGGRTVACPLFPRGIYLAPPDRRTRLFTRLRSSLPFSARAATRLPKPPKARNWLAGLAPTCAPWSSWVAWRSDYRDGDSFDFYGWLSWADFGITDERYSQKRWAQQHAPAFLDHIIVRLPNGKPWSLSDAEMQSALRQIVPACRFARRSPRSICAFTGGPCISRAHTPVTQCCR